MYSSSVILENEKEKRPTHVFQIPSRSFFVQTFKLKKTCQVRCRSRRVHADACSLKFLKRQRSMNFLCRLQQRRRVTYYPVPKWTAETTSVFKLIWKQKMIIFSVQAFLTPDKTKLIQLKNKNSSSFNVRKIH